MQDWAPERLEQQLAAHIRWHDETSRFMAEAKRQLGLPSIAELSRRSRQRDVAAHRAAQAFFRRALSR